MDDKLTIGRRKTDRAAQIFMNSLETVKDSSGNYACMDHVAFEQELVRRVNETLPGKLSYTLSMDKIKAIIEEVVGNSFNELCRDIKRKTGNS